MKSFVKWCWEKKLKLFLELEKIVTRSSQLVQARKIDYPMTITAF